MPVRLREIEAPELISQLRETRRAEQEAFLGALRETALLPQLANGDVFVNLVDLAISHYGVRQGVLADKLRISTAQVGRWRGGKNVPPSYSRSLIISVMVDVLADELGAGAPVGPAVRYEETDFRGSGPVSAADLSDALLSEFGREAGQAAFQDAVRAGVPVAVLDGDELRFINRVVAPVDADQVASGLQFVVMIAGPNGSGKTTLVNYVRRQNTDFGVYINPDDIAATLTGSYDERVSAAQRRADEIRDECLRTKTSFSYETVMSHASKVEFFLRCRDQGFDTVLYYVSTRDVRLNVARVAQRVARGGHDVPSDLIVSRYSRSLALLPGAIDAAMRATIFDNSDEEGLKLGLSKETVGDRERYRLAVDAPDWIRLIAPGTAISF